MHQTISLLRFKLLIVPGYSLKLIGIGLLGANDVDFVLIFQLHLLIFEVHDDDQRDRDHCQGYEPVQ